MLVELGCDLAQGFHIALLRPADELTGRFARQPA